MYGLDQLCLICGTLSTFAVGKIDRSRLVGPLKCFRVWTIPNTCRLRWQSPPKNMLAERLPEEVTRYCIDVRVTDLDRVAVCTQVL